MSENGHKIREINQKGVGYYDGKLEYIAEEWEIENGKNERDGIVWKRSEGIV